MEDWIGLGLKLLVVKSREAPYTMRKGSNTYKVYGQNKRRCPDAPVRSCIRIDIFYYKRGSYKH